MSKNYIKQLPKLFIGNLPWTVGNLELKNYFSKFGNIFSAHVVFNKNNGLSSGYGFVTFYKNNDHNAVLKKDTHLLEGRRLVVKMSNT